MYPKAFVVRRSRHHHDSGVFIVFLRSLTWSDSLPPLDTTGGAIPVRLLPQPTQPGQAAVTETAPSSVPQLTQNLSQAMVGNEVQRCKQLSPPCNSTPGPSIASSVTQPFVPCERSRRSCWAHVHRNAWCGCPRHLDANGQRRARRPSACRVLVRYSPVLEEASIGDLQWPQEISGTE